MDFANFTTSVSQHLQSVREKLGEDAWKAEIRRLAKIGLKTSPKHEVFWRTFIKEFDWINADELMAEPDQPGDIPGPPPPGVDPMRLMVQAMKQTMPGMKSQAQFNAFMTGFDAYRLLMNNIFEGKHEEMLHAKKALEDAIDVAARVTEVTDKLQDVPEAASSKAAEEFKQPPAEFHEYDVQKALMLELSGIQTSDQLTEWYNSSKDRRDRVKSQTLRNTLMDAIREKKLSFQ